MDVYSQLFDSKPCSFSYLLVIPNWVARVLASRYGLLQLRPMEKASRRFVPSLTSSRTLVRHQRQDGGELHLVAGVNCLLADAEARRVLPTTSGPMKIRLARSSMKLKSSSWLT